MEKALLSLFMLTVMTILVNKLQNYSLIFKLRLTPSHQQGFCKTQGSNTKLINIQADHRSASNNRWPVCSIKFIRRTGSYDIKHRFSEECFCSIFFLILHSTTLHKGGTSRDGRPAGTCTPCTSHS